MLKLRHIPVLLLSVLLGACINEEYAGPDPNLPTRTIVVWLGGDNNLSDETVRKIEALRQGWTYTGNKCLIYQDSRDGARLLRLRGGCRTTPVPYVETVREYGAENSASAETFGRVLQEVADAYPADSYGLIFFSHASGWLPQGALNDPGGFGRARPAGTRSIFEDSGCEMPLADFAGALILPGGRKFDFIVLEACFMAGVEVAYELKDKTDHIVASAAEMLSDGFVDVYPEGLSLLMQPEPDLRGFAHAYFQVWNAKSGAYRSATVSVINTAHLDGLAAAVSDIYAVAVDVDVSFVQHFDRYPYHLFFDLSDAIEKMAQPEQKALFDTALNKVVEYEAATPLFMFGESYSFPIDHHCGLTTYIRQTGFPDLNEYYTTLKWYKRLEGLYN